MTHMHYDKWILTLPTIQATTEETIKEFENITYTRYKDELIRKTDLISEFLQNNGGNSIRLSHWLMDSFKQAIDLYVNGYWYPSVVLISVMSEYIIKRIYKTSTGINPQSVTILEIRSYISINFPTISKSILQLIDFRNDVIHLNFIITTDPKDEEVKKYDKLIEYHCRNAIEESIHILKKIEKELHIFV